MKLLFVTGTLPYPPVTGSQLIAYRHIEGLSARHTVDLVAYAPVGAGFERLTNWCGTIVTVPSPTLSEVKVGMLKAFLVGAPLEVGQFWTRSMADAVESRLRSDRYDAALFQLSPMAQFRPDWFDGATILSMEDPLVLKSRRILHHRAWYKRFLFSRNIPRLQRYEATQSRRFDRVLLLNRKDMEDYAPILPDARLDWVPHGVDGTAFAPSPAIARVSRRIVLSGNMHHPPNVDGVNFFCGEVLPYIRRVVPDVETWLVGANPDPSVRAWAEKSAGVHVTGSVPDIKPYLQEAIVSVCAVRLKIGTQTKILEAMACGTPVVTTSAGNHGIEGRDGIDLDVSDDPHEFANRVVKVLTDAGWDQRSRRARAFVEERFTWRASTARLEGILETTFRERVAAAGRGR